MTTSLEVNAIEHSPDTTIHLTGTPSQIEWAVGIRNNVSAEFNRVADAFRTVSSKQSTSDRLDTQAVIAILDEKRAEVLAHAEAGYFIKHWQELSDQVRQLIRKDSRYQSIKLAKAERNSENLKEQHHER
jgi:hypothetical protein